MNDAQILQKLKDILSQTFEVDPGRVSPQASLFEDLDLDSIDAVDLAIQLQEMTGQRIKPQDFKNIRTVDDVVTAVRQLLSAAAA
jgi:acyl carrier protein